MRAFRLGLRVSGFIEGRDVAVEYVWAEGQNDRLPALAAELVRRPLLMLDHPPVAIALALFSLAGACSILLWTGRHFRG
jgi:putative ABC transport system substrate-binding protein